MTAHETLEQLVARARGVVRTHDRHDLPLGLRRAIWMRLGDGVEGTHARRRRARLAIQCAEHVLPVWENAYPDDSTAADALSVAARLLDAESGREDGERIRSKAWDHLVELSFASADHQSGVAAGFSAVQALRTVLDDESLGDEPNEALRDDEIDADDMDASLFASAAYARGPVWEETSEPSMRLAFWEWWLTAAAQQGLR